MKAVQLYAPESYVDASAAERAAVCNGCGPSGWKVDLVPDSLWGLSVAGACNIHDWMYHEGKTIEDKAGADRVMLNNMLRLVNGRTRWRWLRWLRRRSAHVYYQAIKRYGGPAFWEGKNKAAELSLMY